MGVVIDGIARPTPEGVAFQQCATEVELKQTIRERDEPFGDFEPSAFNVSCWCDSGVAGLFEMG